LSPEQKHKPKPGTMDEYVGLDVVFGKFRKGYVASQDLMRVSSTAGQYSGTP